MSPVHKFLDYVIIYLPFFFEHVEDFCAKYFFKGFQVNVRHYVKCAGLSKKHVRGYCVYVRMKLFRVIPKGVYRQNNARSEEHTSELQSQSNLVCRLLLEK